MCLRAPRKFCSQKYPLIQTRDCSRLQAHEPHFTTSPSAFRKKIRIKLRAKILLTDHGAACDACTAQPPDVKVPEVAQVPLLNVEK
jgi:hypothetical protein